MESRLRAIVPWLLLGLTATATVAQPSTADSAYAPASIDADSYAVYSTLLAEWATEPVNSGKQWVIDDQTRAMPLCLKPDGESAERMASAMAAYTGANRESHQLEDHFTLSIPHVLEPRAESSVFSWEAFRGRHPAATGITSFSAVGFNAEHSIAVLSAGTGCGNTCGHWEFFVLQKVDQHWQPLQWHGVSCGATA